MEQKIKNQLIQFALLAEKQGYEAAKKAITESKTPGLDKDFALHIAYLSGKFGQVIGQDAIYFPDKYDKRTENEKIADQIAGSSKHLNPDFKKDEKSYLVGGLEEVAGTGGRSWQTYKPNKEECTGIASMINQGTLDIIASPDKNPLQAMADGELARQLQERLK